MTNDISTTDIIAAISLITAFFSAFMTYHFHQKQDLVNKSQNALNEKLLKKEIDEEETRKKAIISATLYKQSNNNYRLKVWNQGKSLARNIRIDFPSKNNFIHPSDLERKLPYESLDVHANFELMTYIDWSAPPKYELTISWDDDFQNNNTKNLMLSI